jgi:hypothetical protein
MIQLYVKHFYFVLSKFDIRNVAQGFAVAGAEAPLLQLPFVPQGVAAKVSDTTMFRNDVKLVT